MLKSLPIVVAALLVGSAHATSQPTLDHNAPFLGHTLELTVDGAPASQPLVLYYSPHASTSTTPWGTLEIERQTSQRIALGATDAQGHALVSIPIPADASLAENEAHFQALIDDPSAPAGKTLSHGVHVRLLGTRIYVGYYEKYGTIHDSGMQIVSAVRKTTIAAFPYEAFASSRSHPVFTRNFAVGAVLDGAHGLVLFDPFFGTVRARIAFGPCASTLLTDVAEERVFVLETAGRITAVDLASGAIAGVLDLPATDARTWCSNDRRTEAYVGEYAGPQLGSQMRRIDLDLLADRGVLPVADGSPRQIVSGIAFANRTVVVTSSFEYVHPVYFTLTVRGALTRIDLSGAVPSSSVEFQNGCAFYAPTTSASMDQVVFWGIYPHEGGPPGFGVFRAPVTHADPVTHIVPPNTPPLDVHAMVPQDGGMWITAAGSYDVVDPHIGWILHLDLSDLSWTLHPLDSSPYGWYPAPLDLATGRDAYVDALYAALPRGTRSMSIPPQLPQVLVFDHREDVLRSISLDHSPETVRVIEVP